MNECHLLELCILKIYAPHTTNTWFLHVTAYHQSREWI